MLGLVPWALEALKVVAFAAVKPLFMALISSLFNPKFLLKCFVELGEKLASHTDTDFDDKLVSDLKESLKTDLDKYLPK